MSENSVELDFRELWGKCEINARNLLCRITFFILNMMMVHKTVNIIDYRQDMVVSLDTTTGAVECEK